MLIGLVRHGLTDWNAMGKIQGQTDIPLNEEGRRQARLLGERLRQEPYHWDFAISSGLSRAEETAQIIASMLGIPVADPDPRVRERRYGQVEGLTAEEREARFGTDWHQQDLGQESDVELMSRGLVFLDDMAIKHRNSNILVVSHGGFLAQLYKLVCRGQLSQRIGNLSLTIVERKDDDWSPLLYNCTKHLLTEPAEGQGTNVLPTK
ncbi:MULTISPECIES: histidine phosphatase family protein [Paenibacillus]|uniref:Phosphoglycerate mutase n=2 Tax=Paenibacillus lactis TaxID=228574 RepID=G4HFA7_9BACL|nr:histidine phosphatase family protein [Paenibacillus lactis]EHB64424.1 Phosphoglycerate mutase [Paenibacillus lactis 154]MBP1892879.1 putative phosphoglycerate mutase [Paenibacillus lactis]MCM3495192.1 histidine phosphatase family protein [Paenibacillus lactis]HAF97646.1 histidine phosphatase family protein [Paenibacillus lactis]